LEGGWSADAVTSLSDPALSLPSRAGGAGLGLALHLAARDLRGGLRGFYVFILCIALGVMAIAGVGSVAASLTDGIAREGRVLLGGDVAFSLIPNEATAAERTFLETQGRLAVAATFRAMARSLDGRSALVEVKAVDQAYPMYGAVALDPPEPLGAVFQQHGDAFGAAADPTLLARLDLKPGATIKVGQAAIEIRAALTSEPDKIAGGIGFGPRLLMSEEALRATGLLQPGSLVRWHYRLQLPAQASSEADVSRVVAAAGQAFPDAGWEVRTRTKASPSLEQDVERFTQYLTLVGLTALLVGGVGVANAIKDHLERKRNVIATLKSVGATGREIFMIYLLQAIGLAVVGAVPGLAIGAALPFAVAWGFGGMLPLPVAPSLHLGTLVLALLYGVLTAIAFALWPLGRAHDVPVSTLFRDEVSNDARWPRRIYVVATILVVAALAALAVLLAHDRRTAVIFVAAAALVLGTLRLVAGLLMQIARRLPHARATALRIAIANIYRPGALTTSVVLSLGLGLAVLVTVIEIDGNLRTQFMAALPERAPSFFFLDIPTAETRRFDDAVRAHASDATLERVPMLRGRLVAAKGVPVEAIKPSANAAWVLQSDRGITYADEVPAGSRVVEGEWWKPDYSGPPLVSFEQRIAEGLGLKLGDSVTVNVLGREVTARIANLRTLDWQSLGINFVMVFSPSTFRSAPHTDIATLTYPGGSTPAQEIALLKGLADDFPSVTTVRVRDALEAVGHVVTNLVLGLRGATALTLVTALLVLAGALASGHENRVHDAVVLKVLGATRARLIGAYVLEYLLVGGATALFGIAAGSAAAALILTRVMNLSFTWLAGPAFAAAGGAIAATLLLGLLGTLAALGQKPAPVLRNL
jgi:putative ABC transport system permease protein